MLNPNFDILAAMLPVAGCISYARDTFKGKIKPNRVSWTLWCIAPLIAFAAELVNHTHLEVALLTFAVGFGPLLVLIASLSNKKAYWKVTTFDLFCGLLAVLALILWGITGRGDIAIIFSILSELFASIPTAIKSFKHPSTESASASLLSVVGAAITLFTFNIWSFSNYGFPLFILIEEAIMSSLILAPRHTKATITNQ